MANEISIQRPTLPGMENAYASFFSLNVSGQGGPETVMKGPKQFRSLRARRSVGNDVGSRQHILGDRAHWQAHHPHRSGERRAKRGDYDDEVSAPGSQDGLLGMALHPELLQGTGNDYVYAAYTYVDQSKGPNADGSPTRAGPTAILYGKIVRFTYNKAAGRCPIASTSSPDCPSATTTSPGA